MTSLRRQVLKDVAGIIITISLAVGIVFVISFRATRSENKPNGFKRVFLRERFEHVAEWVNPMQVVGIDDGVRDKIWVKTKVPGIVWVVAANSKDSYLDTLPFPTHKLAAWSYQYVVADSTIVIAAGNIPGLFYKEVGNPGLHAYKFGSLPFTKIVGISPASFIARGFDSAVKSKDQVFIKENIISGERITNTAVLPLLHDAGLSTDGNLHYDPASGLLSYVAFYNNGLIALDTNLAVIYRTNTIDSFFFSHTQIGAIQTADEVKFTNAGPKKIVNADNSVHNGILYNRSLIRADNEDKNVFRENAVLDLYNTRKGIYIGSLYMPNSQDEPPISFRMTDKGMFVLYKSRLVQYSLQ